MFRFSFSGTRNIIFGILKIGPNDPEIPNLEFESHGFLENHVYLPTEQAETNICWIIYQDPTFEICLSLFSWKENILPKMHIVHWSETSTPNEIDIDFKTSKSLARQKFFHNELLYSYQGSCPRSWSYQCSSCRTWICGKKHCLCKCNL